MHDDTVYNPLKYYNYLIGFNTRLDALQAGILSVKLPHLDRLVEKRNSNAQKYYNELKTTLLTMPHIIDEAVSAFNMFVVQSENRDALVDKLKEKGISTGVYYPVPMHMQKVYKNLGYKTGDLPNSEYLSHRTFAIPVYPELNIEQQNYIIEVIQEYSR